MSMLLLSLFLTNPAPLEMPRAEAYLVRDGARSYLEDRFDRTDLWTSRTVDGRWVDDEGRVFTLATLAVRPPRRRWTRRRSALRRMSSATARPTTIPLSCWASDSCPWQGPNRIHRALFGILCGVQDEGLMMNRHQNSRLAAWPDRRSMA